MATEIGHGSAEGAGQRARRGGRRVQPRFGAIETQPSLRRTTPTTATPTPISGSSGGRPSRTAAASAARSADDLVDRRVPARPIDPDEARGPRRRARRPRRPASRPRSRGPGRRPRRGSGGRAATAGPGVPSAHGRAPRTTRPASDELADQAADRAAGQPGPGDELGPRQRAALVELADDGAQVRPADRLAALPDLVATDRHGFVFLSSKPVGYSDAQPESASRGDVRVAPGSAEEDRGR